MDTTTLKSLVIELRDLGMTFEAISQKLFEDYGVKRSRQSLCSLYNRAMEASELDKDSQILISHIVNLYCLNGNASATQQCLKYLGYDIGYRKVLDTIKEQRNYINSVKTTIVATIESHLDGLDDIRDCIALLDYKSNRVTDRVFYEYFKKAYEIHIKHQIIRELYKVYSLSGDKEIAKGIGEKFNIYFDEKEAEQLR